MLTIDLTEAVLEEAITARCEAIVAYHPPIFAPLKRLANRSVSERVIRRAAAADLLIHSPHTALDAAPEGLNEWLISAAAAADERGESRPLVAAVEYRPHQSVKVVTLVPEAHLDAVRQAMAEAGAGRIGAYEHCSFSAAGQGTFRGGEGSNPVVGQRGRLERVAEHRLEMVCGDRDLSGAIEALRAAHPYEEPAIKIQRLEPLPCGDAGQGRSLELKRPRRLGDLIEAFKRHLGVRGIDVAEGPVRSVRRIAVCAGSGGGILDAAIESGCDAFLTGELSHHRVLEANARGMAVLLAGHTNTERPYLPVLAGRLRKALPALEVRISRRDRHPLRTR